MNVKGILMGEGEEEDVRNRLWETQGGEEAGADSQWQQVTYLLLKRHAMSFSKGKSKLLLSLETWEKPTVVIRPWAVGGLVTAAWPSSGRGYLLAP